MMLKTVILLILVMGASLDVSSQDRYYPNRPDGFSEAEYRRGRLILENSYAQMKADNDRRCYADYWNWAVAYMAMGQPNDSIYHFLDKAKSTSETEFCTLVQSVNMDVGGLEKSGFYKKLGSSYKNLVSDCEAALPQEEIVIDLVAYAKHGKFDAGLVQELDRILKLDQKYRAIKFDPERQNPLDQQNMKDIKGIISKYGYPGKSLVGERYDFVACVIIQRSSSMKYWDKYLPMISEAVASGELSVNHLKMLLDRIYIDKIGAQLFGSTTGVPFANDRIIKNVKDTYLIDKTDVEQYAEKAGYKLELVAELDRINRLDQQYRSPYDSALQNPLDRKNIKDIEVLLAKYGYPGSSLVGEKYATTAWLVIQHSDLSYQERYLPLIHKAVLSHELANHPLQMLVDRIYVKKTGKQIFGSQGGVDFADDKTIALVKSTYAQQ